MSYSSHFSCETPFVESSRAARRRVHPLFSANRLLDAIHDWQMSIMWKTMLISLALHSNILTTHSKPPNKTMNHSTLTVFIFVLIDTLIDTMISQKRTAPAQGDSQGGECGEMNQWRVIEMEGEMMPIMLCRFDVCVFLNRKCSFNEFFFVSHFLLIVRFSCNEP